MTSQIFPATNRSDIWPRQSLRNNIQWIESDVFKRDFGQIEGVEPLDNPKQMTEGDLIIVVIGPPRAGKTTESAMTGRWYDGGEVGHALQSTTNKISALRIRFPDNINIVLVDTPGFDDTNRSDLDILEKIAKWFKSVPNKNGKISGVIYLHRITDPHITSTVVKSFDMLQNLCGLQFFKKVVLVTTMWPVDGEPDELASREQDLIKNYWGPMIRRGSQQFRFDRTEERAWEIFNHLLRIQHESRWSHLARIQQELLDQGKGIPRTEVGKRLHGLMQGVVVMQNKVIEQLKSELLKPAGRDPIVISALLEELNRLREEKQEAKRMMDALDSSLLGAIRRLFVGKKRQRGVDDEPKSPVSRRNLDLVDFKTEPPPRPMAPVAPGKGADQPSDPRSVGTPVLGSQTLVDSDGDTLNKADSLPRLTVSAKPAPARSATQLSQETVDTSVHGRTGSILPASESSSQNTEKPAGQLMKEGGQHQRSCELLASLLSLQDLRSKLRAALEALQGSDAQIMVDFLNEALESNQPLSIVQRRRLLHLFTNTIKSTKVCPESLLLNGVECKLADEPRKWGGYGEIYQGKLQGQTICVKAVRLDRASEKVLRAHAGEFALWAHMSHPNVLPFYGVYLSGETTARICIVSPWMEAGDLSEHLKANPGALRVLFLVDIASGLKYLHAQDISHSDLKASNVLISTTGRAILADFGVSRVTATQGTNTNYGGTLNWMAPERFESNESNDVPPTPASDMWAFGCTCYEVMTGKTPFEQFQTPLQMTLAVVNKRLDPMELELNPDNHGVWPLMRQCLDLKSENRPLAEDVHHLLTKLDVIDNRPSLDIEPISRFQRMKVSPEVDYDRVLTILQEQVPAELRRYSF